MLLSNPSDERWLKLRDKMHRVFADLFKPELKISEFFRDTMEIKELSALKVAELKERLEVCAISLKMFSACV